MRWGECNLLVGARIHLPATAGDLEALPGLPATSWGFGGPSWYPGLHHEKFLIQPALLVPPKPALFSPIFDHEALEDFLLFVFPVPGWCLTHGRCYKLTG